MRLIQRASGFTLIEVIATLVIVSVLGTVAYVYFGKGFLESVTPVTRLRQTAALHRVMENITADYNVFPKWRSGTNYAKDAPVTPTYFNGHYYKASGGTSSATNEPEWPLSGTVVDGTITWTESGRLRILRPLTTLQTNIGAENTDQPTNEYGKNPDGTTYTKYTVIKNSFIKFENDKEQNVGTGDANNILKVTLKNENGETLTALFFSD